MVLMEVREVLRLFVAGTPTPQGSKRAFVVGTRAVVVDDNKAPLKAWREAVASGARTLYRGGMLEGPVVVIAEFRMPRPKTVKRAYPSVKPDVDKLLRSALDSLKTAGVYKDDGQVVSATASKVYSDRPGVLLRVGVHEPNKEGSRK